MPSMDDELEVWVSAEYADIVEMIHKERQRQIYEEGYSRDHDDAHDKGEIAFAAGNYAAASGVLSALKDPLCHGLPPYSNWPWKTEDFKPVDRERALVKAGALIIAEIERLWREESRSRAGAKKPDQFTYGRLPRSPR